jgi:hypothetical protein
LNPVPDLDWVDCHSDAHDRFLSVLAAMTSSRRHHVGFAVVAVILTALLNFIESATIG